MNSFFDQCDRTHLVLNLSKTKEMVIPRQDNTPETLLLKEKKVGVVTLNTLALY